MNKIVIAVILFIASQNLIAQVPGNSVFNDVIRINSENVATDGFNYILNIPLGTEVKRDLIIENNCNKLPIKAFFSYNLYKFSSITIISPDWAYYDYVRKSDGNGIESEPVTSFKIYKITRNESNKIVVDSSGYNMSAPKKNRPIINYNIPEKKTEDKILVYYAQYWGSACCPQDSKFEHIQEINNLKKKQAEKYKSKNSKIYYENKGYEGEHVCYYSLEDFEPLERLSFIMESEMVFNVSLAQKNDIPKLIYPYYVNNHNLKEKNQFVKN